MRIEKKDNEFGSMDIDIIDFNKVNDIKYGELKMPHNILIHIRKYGSRLGDLSVLFNNLFDDLQDVSLEKNM